MEDKIEVGEYVRLERGDIFKIDEDTVNYYNSNIEFIRNEIVKHSKNIIDLIEVGDYVNGNIVYEVLDDEIELLSGKIRMKRIHLITGHLINEEDIKSILTHEQLDQMKYIVKE